MIKFLGRAAGASLMLIAALAGPAAAGGVPQVSASPASSSGSPIVLTAGGSVTITVTNGVGSRSTSALVTDLAGAAAFSITRDQCSGVALGPNKSCAVTVAYDGATPAQDELATLVVASKKAGVATISTYLKVAGPSFREVCEGLGGTFQATGSVQEIPVAPNCDWASLSLVDYQAAVAALRPLCFNAIGAYDAVTHEANVGCQIP